MSDIILTVPWHCGDSDCPVGWHKADYWLQEDGEYTVAGWGDGSCETVDEPDVPNGEEYSSAWEQYRKHVAETGDDPLGEYMVKHTLGGE